MRLPAIDQFREPFVLPIGHLAMQAAYAETNLIRLCATSALPGAESMGAVSKRLRNWTDAAKAFAIDRATLINDAGTRATAIDAIQKYDELREERHRAIHDAIDVGIDGEDDSGYSVVPLAIRNTPATKHHEGGVFLYQQTAERLADLACEFEDVQKTLNMVIRYLER